jgi:hypothetical protein
MTSASLAMAWLQLLALLAAEVGLIALGVALLQRWSPAAAWRRTFCQAGVTAVLVVTVCELSGSARALGGWAASALAWRKGYNLPQRAGVPAHEPGFTRGLPTILPLPFQSGEGRGEGSDLGFMDAERPRMPGGSLLAPATSVHLNAALAPERQAPAAGQTYRSAGDEASAPPPPTPSRQVFPDNAAATASRSPDSVSDSMGVLWLCLVWAAGATLVGARACLAHCLFMIFQLLRRPMTGRKLAEKVRALALLC